MGSALLEVRLETADWHHWRDRVPVMDLTPKEVMNPNLVIDTIDTVRHVEVRSSAAGSRSLRTRTGGSQGCV